MNWIRALRFMLGAGGDRPAPMETSRALCFDGHELTAQVYAPASPRGTLVAVHGMSPMGNRDPRWVSACRTLASTGFCVVSPRMVDVEALEIRWDLPNQVGHVARAVLEAPELCRSGRLSFFSVSFSGASCLIAAAQAELADRVKAVLAVGTYGDLPTQLRGLAEAPPADPYAWLLILANFIEDVEPGLDGARAALLRAAIANFETGSTDPIRDLGPVPPGLKAEIEDLLANPARRSAVVDKVVSSQPELMKVLDPMPVLPRLHARVTLIHGRDDQVIAADQTRRLAEALTAVGKKPRVSVTGLLTHGDRQLPLGRIVPEAPGLMANLSGFFGDALR